MIDRSECRVAVSGGIRGHVRGETYTSFVRLLAVLQCVFGSTRQTEEMKTVFAAILLVCLWQQAVGGLRWKIFRPCSFLPPFPSARILLFFGPFSVICAGYYCPSDYYDCGDGYCVPDDKVCDGNKDCYNGADEDNCGE